jgi:hypothetical protein
MRRALVLTAAVVIALATAGAAAAKSQSHGHVVITTVADRADLISGTSTLVSITVPAGDRYSRLKVTLGKRSVNREFAMRANGSFEGLLTGLKLGRNVLSAVLPNGDGARITITDHPIGGPVFSGPQIEPWTCEAGAIDKKCDQAPKVQYLYKSTNPSASGLQPYNPADPPSDIATTTTDTGVTVPFIVREETGYEDRDEYRIEYLYQPGKPWQPWAAQPQYAHKLLIQGGFDCITAFEPQTPLFADDNGGDVPATAANPDSSTVALGLGFAVMGVTLDDSQYDCNPALQAESLVIAKEHLVDELGPLSYTIGIGCSGGSLSQQWVANAYPGIYQGIVVQCSFPDAGSTGQQIIDYKALTDYFSDNSGWSALQQTEVMGTGTADLENASLSAEAFYPFVDPSRTGCTGITAAQEYNNQTNPGGVRCGILDWAINLLGPQTESVWDTQEKALGHGFAGSPIDNAGVQYGLQALNDGEITPQQFVDLNAGVGGFNIDWQPTATRMDADEPALANAYRDGIINEGNNMNQVAIIDLRGPNDPGLGHDSYRTFAMQGRLKRDFGTSANQVIWEGPIPLVGDPFYDDQAFEAMNRWLEAVQRDTSKRALPAKIIDDKPSDITDQCSDGTGVKLTSTLCPANIVPVYSTPRMVAGEAITTDQNKCALVPLNRSSYKVGFTNAQWAQLQKTFANGVCDYAKPGVSQQPTLSWMTYQRASGKVIYGGRPLGSAPVSKPFVQKVRRSK